MLRRPCGRCGVPVRSALCASCREAARRTHGRRTDNRPRQQRGYDAVYEANRRAMAELAWTYSQPCVICGQSFERKRDITAEHLIPLRAGGTNDLENLAPAHQRCNSGWRKRRSAPGRPPGAPQAA